jgi:hypothetical protein
MITQGTATLIGTVLSLSAVVAAISVAPATADSRRDIEPIERATFHPPSRGSREVCTTISWGDGDFRTECRIDAPALNPALHGVCMTNYGRRVCY